MMAIASPLGERWQVLQPVLPLVDTGEILPFGSGGVLGGGALDGALADGDGLIEFALLFQKRSQLVVAGSGREGAEFVAPCGGGVGMAEGDVPLERGQAAVIVVQVRTRPADRRRNGSAAKTCQ